MTDTESLHSMWSRNENLSFVVSLNFKRIFYTLIGLLMMLRVVFSIMVRVSVHLTLFIGHSLTSVYELESTVV